MRTQALASYRTLLLDSLCPAGVDCRYEVGHAGVLRLLQAPLQLVAHDRDELPFAEGTISILQDRYCVSKK